MHNVPRHYGVVTDRYKLLHCYQPDDYWELFDLETDPHELKSVYEDAGYAEVRERLEKELSRLRKELEVPKEDPVGTRG